MSNIQRRTFLGVVGTASSAALAGCGDQFSEPAGEFEDNETNEENGTDESNESEPAENETADEAPTEETEDEDNADEGSEETEETEEEEDDVGNEDTEEESDNEDEDAPSPPDQSSLTLTVVGPAGEPIEGATIAGEGEPHEADIPLEFSGETDSNGQYTTEIYENAYTIDVTHPDYEATTVTHTHDGESEITVELEHEAGIDTALLTLTVVNPDGEPIEGASVTGQGEPDDADIPLEFSGETDSNGQYTDVIYENTYTINVDHPDYEATTVTHTHDGESELTVELAPETEETYELTVEVFSGMPDPLAGATVTAGDQTAQTDDDGVATFDLEAGTYTVEATADAYYSETTEVTVESDDSVRLVLDRNYEGIGIGEHDVVVTERADSDDTIDATVVVENQSEFDTESLWLEVTVSDDQGAELGNASSENFTIPANDSTDLDVVVDRSADDDYPEDLTIGDYEITLHSVASQGPIDRVTQSEQSSRLDFALLN